MFSIGIMQGRLSNKIGKPMQSFPWSTWRDEFKNAKLVGFDSIEWLVDDFNGQHVNPISTMLGREEIMGLSVKYGINIRSLCAHHFINGDLLADDKVADAAFNYLVYISNWAEQIGINHIVLPAMDQMSLRSEYAQEKMAKVFCRYFNYAETTLLLESDLPGQILAGYIKSFNSPNIGILYDVGNANSLGFDLQEDLLSLSGLIQEVHMKDRNSRSGASCRLGAAGTPFKVLLNWIIQTKWSGPIVLETPTFNDWRQEALHNLAFTQKLFNSDKTAL